MDMLEGRRGAFAVSAGLWRCFRDQHRIMERKDTADAERRERR